MLFDDNLNNCNLVAFGAIASAIATVLCEVETLLILCSELEVVISIALGSDDCTTELGKVSLVMVGVLLLAY